MGKGQINGRTDRTTGRQGRKIDIYQMKFWNWFPDELAEAGFPDVSGLHADALDWKPSHCNFLLPSGRIVCMSLLLEHNRAYGLAVGTTHSSTLVSRDNGRHGTGTAVNTTQCSQSSLVQLFLRIAGVSYGRFMACIVSLSVNIHSGLLVIGRRGEI